MRRATESTPTQTASTMSDPAKVQKQDLDDAVLDSTEGPRKQSFYRELPSNGNNPHRHHGSGSPSKKESVVTQTC